MSKRQKGIIDMIDAALGEEAVEAVEELGEGEQFLHCSLDSLDRIGSYHTAVIQLLKRVTFLLVYWQKHF